jgi:hypothetical protein
MSQYFKVGDKVRCIRNDDGYGRRLTVGKEYRVIEISGSKECIFVMGDNGFQCGPYADRFELVTEQAEPVVYQVYVKDATCPNTWGNKFKSVEDAEEYVKEMGKEGLTFEIFSNTRTVHKTIKLSERTEVIRELVEVK